MGAVIGSAVCPIVGTIVGAAVGVGVSYFYDLLTKNVKQSARDNLTNAIRNRNRRMCYYDL